MVFRLYHAQISKSGFTTPTPIQSMAWPVALAKHNLIGIASTGSGKTAAYLYPALVGMGGGVRACVRGN